MHILTIDGRAIRGTFIECERACGSSSGRALAFIIDPAAALFEALGEEPGIPFVPNKFLQMTRGKSPPNVLPPGAYDGNWQVD